MTDSQLTKREDNPGLVTVRKMIWSYQKSFEAVLPDDMPVERLAAIVMRVCEDTPALLDCDAGTLMGAIMMSAQLGLEPGILGQAYIIPRGGKAEFQLGYRGMIELASRSGKILKIHADVVYPTDLFEHEAGINETLRHIPGGGDEDPDAITHAYAYAKMANGTTLWRVLTRGEIEKRRPSYNSAAWSNWYASMARKTAVRALFNYIPASAMNRELRSGLEKDGASATLAFNGPPKEPIRVEVIPREPEPTPDPIKIDATPAEEPAATQTKAPEKAPQPDPSPPVSEADPLYDAAFSFTVTALREYLRLMDLPAGGQKPDLAKRALSGSVDGQIVICQLCRVAGKEERLAVEMAKLDPQQKLNFTAWIEVQRERAAEDAQQPPEEPAEEPPADGAPANGAAPAPSGEPTGAEELRRMIGEVSDEDGLFDRFLAAAASDYGNGDAGMSEDELFLEAEFLEKMDARAADGVQTERLQYIEGRIGAFEAMR